MIKLSSFKKIGITAVAVASCAVLGYMGSKLGSQEMWTHQLMGGYQDVVGITAMVGAFFALPIGNMLGEVMHSIYKSVSPKNPTIVESKNDVQDRISAMRAASLESNLIQKHAPLNV